MFFVLLSAVCSVLVSVLLKLARRLDVDVAQAVAWNYLAACALCALLLAPPLASLAQPGAPWPALLGLAVLLPALFLALAASVRRAGIVRTDIAQRLSLLLSLLAAFLLFGERAGAIKFCGLALGLLALLGILARPDRRQAASGGGALPVLLAVWVGFAAVDVLLKQIAVAGTPFAAALMVSFALAFLGLAAWQALRAWRGAARLSWRSLAAGLLLGLLNFGNIIFYVSAHRALPGQPALVFASMNIGVVALAAVVGAVGFGERLSALNRSGIVLAIGAIALIAWPGWPQLSSWKQQLTAFNLHENRMDIDILGFDDVHLLGERATHSPAPRSARHAALLVLAGISPLRPRALPVTPITALASAFNCRFQDHEAYE